MVQNTSNQTSAHAADNFVVTSLRLNGLDAVTPTANPLVALFSGPPCDIDNTVRVRFNQLGSSVSQTTNAIPCSPTNSANFYIAGMYPSSGIPDASRNGFSLGHDRPNWEQPNVYHRPHPADDHFSNHDRS